MHSGGEPDLDVRIIGAIFKTHTAQSDNFRIEINLRNAIQGSVEFYVRIRLREPKPFRSFPQMKIALEKHDIGEGHEHVHVQVQMHKYDNTLKIGKMYLRIDARDEMVMLSIAQGFVCSLYDVLKKMDSEVALLAEEIFHQEILARWRSNIPSYHQAVTNSFAKYGLEVTDLSHRKRILYSQEELMDFLDSRAELVPLIGPIDNP